LKSSMEKTKRILALILLVLCVIFFFASLAGIVLTWVYSQQFSANALSRFSSIEADLLTAQADLQMAKTELDSTRLQIDALQSALETLGLKGAKDIQAIGDLVGKLEDTLVPFISGVADKVKSFQEAIVKLNIPTGVPLVYELDADLKPIKSYYLGDPEAIAAAQAAVAAQGKAK